MKLDVPFRRPGFGVGGGDYTGIMMDIEDDKKVNTCAIIQAVAALPAGLTHVPDDGLDAKQLYTTDYSKLTSDALDEYNKQNSDMKLPQGRLYGVVYEVSYEVQSNIIRYQVKTKLYYAGSDSSKWYEYGKKYNDTYFSKNFLSAVEQQVAICAKPK
ncbi:MAG TPA: hypothetical protein VNB54_14120 [Alphaproteobacteria bacterium]|nr:hypothetical protein [Alphaproteobacteria bacterium]